MGQRMWQFKLPPWDNTVVSVPPLPPGSLRILMFALVHRSRERVPSHALTLHRPFVFLCWWVQKQIWWPNWPTPACSNSKAGPWSFLLLFLLTSCNFLAMMPSFYEAPVTNTIHQKALLCESGHDLLQTPPHSLHNYTGSCNVGSLIFSHILMLVLTPSFFCDIITVSQCFWW